MARFVILQSFGPLLLLPPLAPGDHVIDVAHAGASHL